MKYVGINGTVNVNKVVIYNFAIGYYLPIGRWHRMMEHNEKTC